MRRERQHNCWRLTRSFDVDDVDDAFVLFCLFHAFWLTSRGRLADSMHEWKWKQQLNDDDDDGDDDDDDHVKRCNGWQQRQAAINQSTEPVDGVRKRLDAMMDVHV